MKDLTTFFMYIQQQNVIKTNVQKIWDIFGITVILNDFVSF